MAGTFTLTGRFKRNDGVTPYVNSTIRIDAAPFPDITDNTVYSSSFNIITDGNGSFSITLVTETSLYYRLSSSENLFDPNPFTFAAPTAGTTLDVSDLTVFDPSTITPTIAAAAAASAAAAIAAAASVAVSTWQANTAVVTNQIVKAPSPDGSEISSNSSRTTRPSFDATEQTFWTPVVTKAAAMSKVALDKAYNGVSNQSINVKHPTYGATGNGTTDDTAAIAAAVTAAKAAQRTLYFPAGTYKITSNQTIDWDYATIIGDGANTVLNFVGCGLVFDGSVTIWKMRQTLRDVRINRSGTAGPAVLFKGSGGNTGAVRWTIDNVDVKGSTGDGLEIAGSFLGTISGSYFRECTGRGVWLHQDLGTGNVGPAAISFVGGEIQLNGGGGVEMGGGPGVGGISFYGTCVEGNTGFGARINGGNSVSFYGCYMESNSTSDITIGDVTTISAVRVDNCILDQGTAVKTKSINVVRGKSVSITNNSFTGYLANSPITINEASAGAVTGTAQNNVNNGTAAQNVALNGALSFSALNTVFQNSAALDFPSIGAGSSANLTISVPGATVGDTATCCPITTAYPPTGIVLSATVGAAGVVTVRAQNVTAGAIDPPNAVVVVVVHHWGG